MNDASAEQESAVREIRINPVVPDESVLIATARSLRPRKAEQPAPRDTRARVDTCPFCKGNEAKTPPTLYAWPDEADWQLRIVENLFPVLGDDAARGPIILGLQQAIDGYGRHEVIIDHHHHGIALHDMDDSHIAAMFGAFRDRMKALYANDARLRYVMLFKNFGPAAGASIAHTHSQLIAMPVVPEQVHKELMHSRQHYQKFNQCVFCALIDEALTFEATVYDRTSGEVRRKINAGQYIIERGEHFLALKPFASRFEWEVQILPLSHSADFLQLGDDKLQDFARVLKNTMARLDQVIGGAQYNFFLHSLPRADSFQDCGPSYHWHLEICPRTSIPTGFELGSGLTVNTISPEIAAERLRAVVL